MINSIRIDSIKVGAYIKETAICHRYHVAGIELRVNGSAILAEFWTMWFLGALCVRYRKCLTCT